MPRAVLAAALVSAGGGGHPPRGERLGRLALRLSNGENFATTLCGARVVAEGKRVLIGREPGDLRRQAVADVALAAGQPGVWDGRYQITVAEPGWTVTAALARLGALSEADRAVVNTVPAWARGALPVLVRSDVLIRDDRPAPVLAWRTAEVLALAPRRLELALTALGMGETTQETDLFRPVHGEMPPTDLFSRSDYQAARVSDAAPRDRGPK